MKKLLLSFATVALLASCGGSEKTAEKVEESTEKSSEETTTTEESTDVSGTYTLDVEASEVKWEGDKVVGSGHVGVIAVQSGNVVVENGSVSSASVVIDMSTVKEIDYDSEEYAQKLEGHLMSGDFFKVEEFPTSSMTVKSVKDGNVTGDLTIKDVTKEITFPAEISVSEDAVNVKASFSIDRTDYGVVYGSGNYFTDLAKDKVIKDKIDFKVNLTAKK